MKKQKTIIGILTLTIIAIISSCFIYLYVNTKGWANLIYPGVQVEGEDLGGKTKKESIQLLNKNYNDAILDKNLTVKLPDSGGEYKIKYSKLNPKYNIDDIVNEAFSYGKKLNLFKKYKLINNPQIKNFKLKFSYDSELVEKIIGEIEKEVNKNPIDASLKLVGNNLQITPDKPGAKLKTEKLKKEILSNINGNISEKIIIDVPFEKINAKITKDKLSKVNSKISGFSTNYAGSSSERINNISLATNTINGTIIMPGDTFSFNKVVGKRTAEKGYKSAPIIVGNKVDSGLGGGTCQVSTTLYNAVLRANIQASERTHHTIPSNYIGLGMDATVDYGNIDYKFVNSHPHPIYIEGYTKGNTVGFNIYSNSQLLEKSYDIVNEVYETLKPDVEYISDSNITEGEMVEEQSPSPGYKVNVFKNTYQNGKVVDRELISNDIYLPVNRVIRKGSKK